MTELEQYITSYFGVSQEDLSIIASLFIEQELKKGEYFTKIDDYCNKLSFIRTGYMRVYAYKEEKEVTQWISSQGYFVTDLQSLVFDLPSRWNIEALTDCELYTISKENYRKISQKVAKWEHLEKLFLAKCFLTLEDRVFSFLSMTAEERYDHLYDQNKELFNIIPLQNLASMLGMTPETLSRIRKKKLG
ncbi:MAG: Crp/Fnr family transcriptional regulator [Crocinitomicaceae bacterium]